MPKSILITGASTGIGYCAAQILQKRGYQVFPTARQLVDVERLRAEGFASFSLDVTDSTSIQQALAEILKITGGTLDVLFSNAGYVQAGAVEDLSLEAMRAQFETNVFGAIELTNQVLPIMRRQGAGRIIQNTSILGIIAMPFRGAYVASKFALEGFTNTLRQELADTPLKVSILVPGPIRSELRNTAQRFYEKYVAKRPSVHSKLYHAMQKYFKPDSPEGPFTAGPELVVKKLIHAIESKNPKAHYYVGFPANLFAFLRRILPDKTLDFILLKILAAEQK